MIKYKKLGAKNFLSIGQDGYEIELDTHKMTLIQGRNGTGKSTLGEILCFVLFNRAFRDINKNQLINSINGKGCIAWCEFEIGPDAYRVVRGIKPAVFEIYKNGDLVPQPKKSTDYQVKLEKEIIRSNFETMTQVDILGSAQYTPFMELKTPARRKIVEDLLGISAFSVVSDLAKAERSTLTQQASILQSQLNEKSTYIRSLNEQKALIEMDQTSKKEELQNQISQTQTVIEGCTSNIRDLLEEIDKAKVGYEGLPERETVTDRQQKYRYIVQSATADIAKIKKFSSFLEETEVCSLCGQEIDEKHKAHIAETQSVELIDLEAKISDANEKLDILRQIMANYESVDTIIANFTSNLSTFKQDYTTKNQLLVMLEQQMLSLSESAVKTSNQSLIDKIDKEINELRIEQEVAEWDIKDLAIVINMMKDDGVKTEVIDTYIPKFNSLINEYLERMNFFCSFHFDNEFNEILKSRYRDEFTYPSFSEGEKMKINLAILFAWRKIAALKGSLSSNLLYMDELADSSIDQGSIEDIMKIIRDVSEDTSVIVISHSGMTTGFDRTITVEKVDNFSRYTDDSQ